MNLLLNPVPLLFHRRWLPRSNPNQFPRRLVSPRCPRCKTFRTLHPAVAMILLLPFRVLRSNQGMPKGNQALPKIQVPA